MYSLSLIFLHSHLITASEGKETFEHSCLLANGLFIHVFNRETEAQEFNSFQAIQMESAKEFCLKTPSTVLHLSLEHSHMPKVSHS